MPDRLDRTDVRTRVFDVDADRPDRPEASVVVVTYGRDIEDVRPALEGLGNQTETSFEVILLDGGTDWDLRALQSEYDVVTAYVEFEENYGVNVGRNVGAQLANGDVLVFLDDDAVPASDFVEHHVRAHRDQDIVAARGRIFPKTPSVYNQIAPRYDLGEESIPSPIDAEANASFDREVFEDVGGFDEDIFGHEGLELTARLLERHDRESLRYVPGPVVYHDFADRFSTVVKKKTRHKYYKEELGRKNPDLFELYSNHDFETETGTNDRVPMPMRVVPFAVNRSAELLSRLWVRVYAKDQPTK